MIVSHQQWVCCGFIFFVMDSSYARVVHEDRIPMLRYRGERTGGQAEDLSQSLFFGFNSVLNGRDARIDAGKLPPEPLAPSEVVDQSDAYFWSSNPNHSLLLINDLKFDWRSFLSCSSSHFFRFLGTSIFFFFFFFTQMSFKPLFSLSLSVRGQVYIDDVSSNSIAWDKLLRRWLVASLLLPLYILYSLRGTAPNPHLNMDQMPQPRASPVYRGAVFVVGTLYYIILFGSSVLYFFTRPSAISVTEVLLPLALHFFCFFVEALLCSIELTSVESFDEAADRIMCRMEVTGTSYAWQAVDTGFLPPNLRTSESGADMGEDDVELDGSGNVPAASDTPVEEAPERENIVAPSGAPVARGQLRSQKKEKR